MPTQMEQVRDDRLEAARDRLRSIEQRLLGGRRDPGDVRAWREAMIAYAEASWAARVDARRRRAPRPS